MQRSSVLLRKLGSREGKVLGSEEGKAVGSARLSYEQTKEVELGLYCVRSEF
jgi:hypothetical protein